MQGTIGIIYLSVFQALKTKFIEGGPFFMGLITLTLIFGLAFCLERIIYLNLAHIPAKKFLSKIGSHLEKGDLKEAQAISRQTRGPVAAISSQALAKIEEPIELIDKTITSTGNVQIGLLEKNLSWITLFIAIAPALGFLGTVLGMIQTFDDVQRAGDITPTIVSAGMKVALITTVGGLIVAIILQIFYNYLLNKVENIINDMENQSIAILDMIVRYKRLR
ncbi:MAG: MotA/TolQ/ExbB proton channel family protein [Dysgonamonadaceae bacterium]|jgi:biopolymer transport protein ExbB|nr:MotA/TolQ/ExbB proton channel family protein [Dysgonamonadaceae bacterium]